MTEQGSPEGIDISELKTHGDLKNHALGLSDKLFSDPGLSRITIRNIYNWTGLFPELAKRYPVLKQHSLELISYVRYASDELSANSPANEDEFDEDEEESEEWEDEEEEPALKIELNFLAPIVENAVDEETESASSELHFCLYEKDSYAHVWASVEEKPNVFFERSTGTRQGAVPRLRIISELLNHVLERVSD